MAWLLFWNSIIIFLDNSRMVGWKKTTVEIRKGTPERTFKLKERHTLEVGSCTIQYENNIASQYLECFCFLVNLLRSWCYTMENLTRWEWCDVPYCGGWKMTFQQDCGSMSLRQEDYRGTMAITATGKTCQVWDSDFPHFHVRTSDRHPNAGLENNNYCRNPIGYSAA